MPNAAPIKVGRELEREFPGADHRATALAINLVRAHSLVVGELSQILRRHDLSLATFNVLMILRGAGRPLCPFEIGERLLVTRGTVTGLLDTLERQGLIRRAPHPDDRRMLHIEMTAKARRMLNAMLPGFHAEERRIFENLSAREKETLLGLLGSIQNHVAPA